MGLRQRRNIRGSALLFVTTTTLGKKRLFSSHEAMVTVQKLLFKTARDKEIILMGYVIMPSHLHLLIGVKYGGNQLSKFMHSLKGRIRKDLYGDKKIWEGRFDNFLITTEKQFRIKLEYIHNNPVKAGLIEKSIEWIFSSALDWEKRESDNIVFDFEWL